MFKQMKATFASLLATLMFAFGMPSAANAIPLAGSFLDQYTSPVTGFTQFACGPVADCLSGVDLVGYFGEESEWTSPPPTRVIGVDVTSRPDLFSLFTSFFGAVDDYCWQGANTSGVCFAWTALGNDNLQNVIQATYKGPATFVDLTPPPVPHPVPEPETYALLLAGLGVIGLVSRRKKTTAFRG